MTELEAALEFAEQVIHQKTETFCSELQRQILIAALREERVTYDQIADNCGYSDKYVKQDVAPKLWQLLSQALGEKVTKANVRSVIKSSLRKERIERLKVEQGISGNSSLERVAAVGVLEDYHQANILLVDDQPKNLRLLTELLEEQGYEVQQAINGKVALQAIANHLPDLVLLDIHLPEMDGYTVCQKIKASPQSQSTPVIFVSALDEPWDKVKAFSVGGSDYISKPFKVVEVLARVENQLKIQQLQRRLIAQNSRLQQAIQELQRLAAIDELTQVASRRRFDAYLLDCWQQAKETQQPLTLTLIQVHNIERYGEGSCSQAGDHMLSKIAYILQRTMSSAERLVARYGTITFVVVLPGHTQLQGEQLINDFFSQIQASLSGAVDLSKVAFSVGIKQVIPAPDTGIEDFLEACDQNLQWARSQRNEKDSAIEMMGD